MTSTRYNHLKSDWEERRSLRGIGVRVEEPNALKAWTRDPEGYRRLTGQAEAEDLTEFRRHQEAFRQEVRRVGRENRWMAVPALAPVVVGLGLGGAGAMAARAAAAAPKPGPLVLTGSEAWPGVAGQSARRIVRGANKALRRQGRARLAQANGISAADMQAEVHHSWPMEFSRILPRADPNRLANLWGLRGEAHDIATRAWADFRRSLGGRLPTQAEIMEAKLMIDRLVAPYVRRAGVPRSNIPPREGGPV